MYMRVVTYSTPRGGKLNLTPGQAKILRAAGTWPRANGVEFCQVSRGEHVGLADFSNAEIALIIEDEGDIDRALDAAYRRLHPEGADQG